MNNNTFVKDRDEALLSLDEKIIRSFFRKYNYTVPDNPLVFWASVYKSILAMNDSPADIRKKAADWLDSHGFQRTIESARHVKCDRFPRHTFEHVILPTEFYRWGDRFVNQVIDGDRHYMSDLYSNMVEPDSASVRSCKAKFFKVLRKSFIDEEEHITIVRIDLPRPSQVTECRRIYLCRNETTNTLMYFTSELSAEGTYFLCAWTKNHSYLLLGTDMADQDEFGNIADHFRKLAGYEPPMPEAM